LCRCPKARRGWPLFTSAERWAQGGLIDVLLKQVRDETSLDVKRADFKLDMLSPHLFMNFRITDEHGRQLGQGRNLGALKAEWGAKARGAFQALASLKVAAGAGGVRAEGAAAGAPAAPLGQGGRRCRRKSVPAQAHDARYKDWALASCPS
jgi:ATP-dependent helicase HrpA